MTEKRLYCKRIPYFWRDVRVVEGTRLEVVCARDGTEGSNPSLSVPGPMQKRFFESRQIRKEAAVD